MTVLVSQVKQMISEGVKIRAVACASTGDTSAALAAYCAAAGIECVIAIVETAPEGKLQQMLAYGAKLYADTYAPQDPAWLQSVKDRTADQLLGMRGPSTNSASSTVNVNIGSITQQPGENGEGFANRVAKIVREHDESSRRAAFDSARGGVQ